MCIRNYASAIKTVRCPMVIKKNCLKYLISGISYSGFIAVFIAFLFLNGCTKKPSSANSANSSDSFVSKPQIELALGTVCVINLYGSGDDQVYSRIFSRIQEIDRTMTVNATEFQNAFDDMGTFEPDSETSLSIQIAADSLRSGIAAINKDAGLNPVKVRPDIIEVLERALFYAELSGGAFDPTVGPLVKLWGIGTESQQVPSENEIAGALALVNWQDVEINQAENTVFLRRKGMALDLGAIAKGYAADEAARIAKEGGVASAVIDLGGNILTIGWRKEKGENKPWRIGIQDPLNTENYIGIISVNDTSVVTSGVYERYFMYNEKRYHHILSTADGYPVDNDILSVSIVTEKSIEGDALSTVLFTLGLERGKALADSIPGVEALFILSNKDVIITDGLKDIFLLTDTEYSLIAPH